MNENVQKSLVMGASIMVTIGIISIGLMIFSQGNNLVKESSKNMVDLTQELSLKRYIAYEDTLISGSEVINAINKYANDNMNVLVKTLSNSTGESYTGDYSMSNISNDNYINTTGVFESKLDTNTNGVVESIIFTQVEL